MISNPRNLDYDAWKLSEPPAGPGFDIDLIENTIVELDSLMKWLDNGDVLVEPTRVLFQQLVKALKQDAEAFEDANRYG